MKRTIIEEKYIKEIKVPNFGIQSTLGNITDTPDSIDPHFEITLTDNFDISNIIPNDLIAINTDKYTFNGVLVSSNSDNEIRVFPVLYDDGNRTIRHDGVELSII